MRQSGGSQPRPKWPSTTTRSTIIAVLAMAGIVAHLALRWGSDASTHARDLPLFVVLAAGGVPGLTLALKLVRRQFGSDLLAGISIVACGAARRVPGGCARRADAVRRGGPRGVRRRTRFVRAAGAGPANAARRTSPRRRRIVDDVRWTTCAVGDELRRPPPRDLPRRRHRRRGPRRHGRVVSDGRAVPDVEGTGIEVLSGAINGDSALTFRADRLAVDSRYARIMDVMRDVGAAATAAPPARRPARRLVHAARARRSRFGLGVERRARRGSWPCLSSRRRARCSSRIPVAIIGAISLAAKRGIVIEDPGRARADRHLPHDRLRQDRHVDVRRTDA